MSDSPEAGGLAGFYRTRIDRTQQAMHAWLGDVRPQKRHLRTDVVAGLPGAISSERAGRRQPRARALRVVRGVDRWRAEQQHPLHGDHDDQRGRPRRGIGGRGRARQIPTLAALDAGVVAGAAAVAALVLIQGAGVAEAVPNPDGSTSSTRRDFTAQGLGNLTSGFFGGQPVGGCVGQTALNVASRSRRADGSSTCPCIEPDLAARWQQDRVATQLAGVEIVPATPVIGDSTEHAVELGTSHRVDPATPETVDPTDGVSPES